MDREISSHQPSDHMTAGYMEHCGVEMVGVVQFGGDKDYSLLGNTTKCNCSKHDLSLFMC